MFNEEFALNLKSARDCRGITQTQLANMIGVIPQCISSYECGRTMPNLLRLSYLVSALCVSFDDLIPLVAYNPSAFETTQDQLDIFDELGEGNA